MTVFFDTNVLLDILDDTREHHEAALTLLKAAEKGVFRAHATTQSFIDAAYIQTQQRKRSLDAFRTSVALLSGILSVESILASDLAKANRSPVADYEDAAQLACAERIEVDYILTRDGKFNQYTQIPTYTPAGFYAKLFR
jgi:predicted nucleic acid-binding protein